MEKMTFDQMMKRLQEIVSLLEKNEGSLETSITLFEEGLQLMTLCEAQLEGFESKVEQLMTDYAKGKNQDESAV